MASQERSRRGNAWSGEQAAGYLFEGGGVFQPGLRLRAVVGPQEVDSRLPPEGVVIGRSRRCGLVLRPGETVSRAHCSVVPALGHWVIDDLGSKHGTFVNGERLDPGRGVRLLDGDEVRIGPWTLVVELG